VDLRERPGCWEGIGDVGGVGDGLETIEEAADEEEEVLWLRWGGVGRVFEGVEARSFGDVGGYLWRE